LKFLNLFVFTNGGTSLLWLPDLVALELKEICWDILKELQLRADCFKLLTKNNISWSSRVIMSFVIGVVVIENEFHCSTLDLFQTLYIFDQDWSPNLRTVEQLGVDQGNVRLC